MTPAVPAFWLPALLAAGVLLAWARLAWWQARAPAGERASRVRLLALFVLQPACAALLYFTLVPPRQATTAEATLVVMTARASGLPLPGPLAGARRIALPEADTVADAERMPDLATALRAHPGVRNLHVVGAGLEARDLDAVDGRAVAFTPAPLPRGVVRLAPLAETAPGTAFAVAGRVEGVPQAKVELHDPAGQRIDFAAIDAQGGFVLHGLARLPGPARFALQVLDAEQRRVETLAVPVWTQAPAPPRTWVLAGAPNAELKYLRRWATDAGLPLHLQVGVGGGLQLGDPPLPLSPDTLRRFDLLVLDARSAAALGAGQRAAVRAAVRDGLGLLLRADGPVSPELARAFGLPAQAGNDELPLLLPRPAPDDAAWRARRGNGSTEAPVDAEAVAAGLPVLAQRRLRAVAPDALPLLRDAEGRPVAYWRAEGRGRVAVWAPQDSYVLALAGHGDLHGALWAGAFASLARAAGEDTPPPVVPDDARVELRTRLCGLPDAAHVLPPEGGRRIALHIDPATGPARCAAFWPTNPGWHYLDTGAARWPFHVRDADEAPGLRAAELRERTLALTGADPATVPATASGEGERGPSWPWFLGWLAAAALSWWLERHRRAPVNDSRMQDA